jgi:hypothetical protein
MRSVKRGLKRKRSGSTRRVAKRMKTKHGVKVSHMTVYRAAKAMELRYRIRPTKPLLTPRHKQQRIAFARTRRPRNFWEKVLWTDEASFALYSNVRGQWVSESEKPENRTTVKWPARIRVWAGISAKGKTKLIKIPQRMGADEYIDMLKTKGIPEAHRLFGTGPGKWVLMQDGDGSHTAKKTLKFLDAEGVQVLRPWPARSPDLNPIENAWSMVERSLQMQNPCTRKGLWSAMKKGWSEIDHPKLVNLCGSVKRRLEMVIANSGAATKY